MPIRKLHEFGARHRRLVEIRPTTEQARRSPCRWMGKLAASAFPRGCCRVGSLDRHGDRAFRAIVGCHGTRKVPKAKRRWAYTKLVKNCLHFRGAGAQGLHFGWMVPEDEALQKAARELRDKVVWPGDFRDFRRFRPGRFLASHGRFAARQERTPRYISLERRPGSPNMHVDRLRKFGRNVTRGR